MFTPNQDVQWWAYRYKWIRQLCRQKKLPSNGSADFAMANYANLLVACFTVLFNERQKKGTTHDK